MLIVILISTYFHFKAKSNRELSCNLSGPHVGSRSSAALIALNKGNCAPPHFSLYSFLTFKFQVRPLLCRN